MTASRLTFYKPNDLIILNSAINIIAALLKAEAQSTISFPSSRKALHPQRYQQFHGLEPESQDESRARRNDIRSKEYIVRSDKYVTCNITSLGSRLLT